MNAIPLLLLLLTGLNGNNSIKDLLKNINTEQFAPVLKSLGIDDNLLAMLQNAGGLLGGSGSEGFSLKNLLPVALSLMNGKLGAEDSSSQYPQNETVIDEGLYLNPIRDIADGEINYELSHYFSNT